MFSALLENILPLSSELEFLSANSLSLEESKICHLGKDETNPSGEKNEIAWYIKGGYLDFSHLTEFNNIYITEIYMKKQYKSSIIKNHEITKIIFS